MDFHVQFLWIQILLWLMRERLVKSFYYYQIIFNLSELLANENNNNYTLF